MDAVSGGAGNDTITGLVGASGTFTVGDSIVGAAGTDTLNLTDAGSATAVGYTELSSVETVNVRMLSAGTTVVNANGWSGTTKISNASSLVGTTLQVSGVETSTTISISEDADVNVGYRNTTTGGTVSVQLVNAGNLGTATTLASAAAGTGGTANLDLDLANAGLITGVSVTLLGSRTDFVRLEAGSNVTTYTIAGDTNAVLVTDDTVTSFDASAAKGNIDVTFDSASEVVVKGGAGNDIVRLGTTISNGDSFDGGAGTDTLKATIGGFSRNLNATNVETADINFSDDAGGTVNATASSVTTYNLLAASAGADANISGVVNGATVNLTSAADALDDVAITAASGASTLALNVGTGSGSVALDLVTVGGAASVSLTAATNTTGTNSIASATFASTVKSLSITTVGGDADLNITDLAIGGTTGLTITSNGSAGMDFATGVGAAYLNTITVQANGTDAADISLDSIDNSTGLTLVTLDANSGADIFVSGTGIEFGNGASAGIKTAIINLAAETNSLVGTAASAGSGIRVLTTGSIDLTINIDAAASAGIHLGTATIAAGSATAETTAVLNISAGTLGANAVVRLEKFDIDGQTGTQVNLGPVSVGGSAQFVLASAGIDATNVDNVDINGLNLTLAASGWAEIGAVTTTAGMLNAVNLAAADGASATFGAVIASGMGAVTVSVASGASANFGAIVASGSAAGTIVGAVGAIELSGSDAGGVTFGTIGASAVGAISVSGALDVTFGTITANRIGAINTLNQGASGNFTIDLAGVSAAAELTLGAATNTVISGDGNDVITLKAGVTGNDHIQYNSAIAGTDEIVGFFAGTTGADKIELVSAGFGVSGGFRDADGVTLSDSSTLVFGTGISGACTLGTTGNILVLATGFASTGALTTFLTSAGAITFATADMDGSGNFVAIYTDNAGTDTYVAVVHFESAAAAAATLASASEVTVTNLAVIKGVSPGALVASNFDIV